MATVLIFARQPVPGRVKTRLAAAIGDAAACRLYCAFLRDLCAQLARRTGRHTAWWVDGDVDALMAELGPAWGREWTIHRQPDGDLGHRLRIAVEQAFVEHSGPVAVIGSDCPPLDAEQLDGLFAPMERGFDAVLLPAEDGGYAGLVLNAPDPDLFRGIPWSTPQVAQLTLARLRGSGRQVRVLPPVFDVDTVADLRSLERLLHGRPERAPHTSGALAELEIRGGG